MTVALDHDAADWAGSAGGYVCLHCAAFLLDSQWGELVHPAAPVPEPKPRPKPKAKKAAAKKA